MTLPEIFHILFLCLVVWLMANKWVQHDRAIFRIFILVKFLAAISVGVLYIYHYEGGDTIRYFQQSARLIEYYSNEGLENWWKPLTGETSFLPTQYLLFSKQPRAIFFSSLLVPFTAFCLKNYWLTSLWLTLFSSMLIWWCYRQLSSFFHSTSLILAILFWPSLLFWSSGITKEVVAMPLFFYLITLCIKLIEKNKVKWWEWIVLVVAALVLWKVKYYYAAILIPFLFVMVAHSFLSQYSQIFNKFPYVTWMVLLGIVMSIATLLHPNLNIDRMWHVITTNYFDFKNISSEKAFIELYIQNDGTVSLITMPIAIISGLYRPFIWESWNILSLAYGIENLVLVLGSIISIIGFIRQKERASVSLLALSGILFIIFSAALLTISAPNFGTLSRYAICYKPIVVWLLIECIYKYSSIRYFDSKP